MQAQHSDLGREKERLQAALAERQSASVAADAPDAFVEGLLEAVSEVPPLQALSSPCLKTQCIPSRGLFSQMCVLMVMIVRH